MSSRAVRVGEEAECVAGYITYLDLIKTLVADKKLISTGMMKEVERMEKAAAGMQSVIFIGSRTSLRYMDFLFTPREYTKKIYHLTLSI